MLNARTEKKNHQWIYLAGIALLAVLLLFALLGFFSRNNRTLIATKLRCLSTQNVTPFRDEVLYYDGLTLYCLRANGDEHWSYSLGVDAHFTCGENAIAAWSGTQLHIIDRNGRSTYTERLNNSIQFVSLGTKYLAVAVGSDASPTVYIKDMEGNTVSTLLSDFQDMVVLDMGFFSRGEYLWTTSVDIYGSVPDVTMQIFQVGGTLTGPQSMGEHLIYDVIFAGDRLNVISTRQLRQYDYRGIEDKSGAMLIYGWQLIDHMVSGRNATMLFCPSTTSTTSSQAKINQLRLISGKTDKRYSLPSTCVGAAIGGNYIYGFAQGAIYRSGINDRRFTTISLPDNIRDREEPITDYLGMLTNGYVLLASDNDVYTVSLP